MSRDGSGAYNRVAGTPYVNGTTIDETVVNAEMDDIKAELTNSVAADGQTTMTGDLKMGTKKVTGAGAATALTDVPTASQVQNGAFVTLGTVAGTNTITAVAAPVPADYAAGQTFRFIPAGTNTGATTLNISSLGAKNVFRNGAACAGGEIKQNVPCEVFYDGTQFNIIGPDSGPITGAGLTMATAKLLGRTTAGAGAPEEITVGTGINLAAGTITANDWGINLATAVASTSGTSIDFTSIPAGAKRITINLAGVSTNGISGLLVQIGDSGGVETSGYVSAACEGGSTTPAQSTAGFLTTTAAVAANAFSGRVVLSLEKAAAFTWCNSGLVSNTALTPYISAGSKSLTAELDRVRITTVNGTDAFDAGEINITYE